MPKAEMFNNRNVIKNVSQLKLVSRQFRYRKYNFVKIFLSNFRRSLRCLRKQLRNE